MADKRKNLPRARSGDLITAEMWNSLVDAINFNRVNFGQGNGFEVQQTPWGQLVRATGAGGGGVTLAKTSSSISARSGTAAGSGTVTPQSFDGSALADDGDDITVYSFSGTSIDTGKYCAIADIDGDPFVISVEC